VCSGRDVLVMAALGADEYGFGTVAMIATGCIMARVCHTNNCPVGVASQREELRARFPGAPSDVVHFFEFVAEEVRSSDVFFCMLFFCICIDQVSVTLSFRD
jgi:glutamate synthase (ferredoxin)